MFNRDRSRIVSEFNAPGGAEDWDERHTVVTPDGGKFTFQTSGDTQTIYDGDGRPISAAVWTNNGPEPLSLVQPAFWPGAAAGAGVAAGKGAVTEFGLAAAAAALFTWLSSRNGPDGTAIFAFKAVEYRKVGPENKPDAEWVGRLTRDQVNKVCGQLKDVQGRTDDAVAEVRKVGGYKNAADFGTKVHKMIADGIKAVGDDNYRAEVSLIKSKLEQDADYGELDSVRIDALENRPETSTVCVYDPKTGKRGFRPSRMTELAQTVLRVYPKTQRIFVIEVRPGQR